jgi:hypothetical protein
MFVILDIDTNKIRFWIFLKYRSSSHNFNKLVTKSKKIKKIIFVVFLYAKICKYNLFLRNLAAICNLK